MRSVLGKVNIRFLVATFYAIFVPLYIIIGLQPAGATVAVDSADTLSTLTVPAANISSEVIPVELNGKTLTAPDQIIGSFSMNPGTTFLFAHSSTAFKNLHLARLGDTLYYQSRAYTITSIETKAKSDINMSELLAGSNIDKLILMTCTGEPLGGGDYSHRLIVTAE